MCVRPLTQEEIARRRELARQRHADRMESNQGLTESERQPTPPQTPPQGDQPVQLCPGELMSHV